MSVQDPKALVLLASPVSATQGIGQRSEAHHLVRNKRATPHVPDNYTPDKSQAQLFLEILTGSADTPVTWQIFPNQADAKPSAEKALTRVRHGTLAQHFKELEWLNTHAAVCVMINEGTGAGRKDADVTRVRAVFMDFDGAPLPEDWPLEPHLLTISSLGRWHVYYLVADLPPSEFKVVQRALAEQYGTDPAVSSLSQVMRVPGFIHRKGAPFMSRLDTAANHAPFTRAEMLEAFPGVRRAVEDAEIAAAQPTTHPAATQTAANDSAPCGRDSAEETAPVPRDPAARAEYVKRQMENGKQVTRKMYAQHDHGKHSQPDTKPATATELQPELQAAKQDSQAEPRLAAAADIIKEQLELLDSHAITTEQLAPYKKDLGLAYHIALGVARLSNECATDSDPSPHIFAPYWAIGVLVGRNKDTVGKHIRNTAAFSLLFDFRPAYTTWLEFPDPDTPAAPEAKNKTPQSQSKIAGMMIRYFPDGRRSPECRIRDYYQRDLHGDSKAGKTEVQHSAKNKHAHSHPAITADYPVRKLIDEHNLPIRILVPGSSEAAEAPQQTPADMSTLSPEQMLRTTRDGLIGHIRSLTGRKQPPSKKEFVTAYSRFVELTAAMLVRYFNDADHHKSWMSTLYTCLRNEIYNQKQPEFGWHQLTRMFHIIAELSEEEPDEPIQNILAVAWSIINERAFDELAATYKGQPVNTELPLSPDVEPDEFEGHKLPH